MNDLSLVSRSSSEVVYEYSKQKNKSFLQLKWLSNQSKIVTEPVVCYPLGLPGFSVANWFEFLNYQSLSRHLSG